MIKISKYILVLCSLSFVSCTQDVKVSNQDIDYKANEIVEENQMVSEVMYLNDVSEDNATEIVKLYLYSASADKYFYVNTSLNCEDSDLKLRLEESLKSTPHSSLVRNLPNETKLDIVENNEEMITINLDGSFITNDKLNQSVEYKVLQCIVNTIGEAYNVSNVSITIDNKPYEFKGENSNSSNIFTVSTEGIQQFIVNN